MGASPGEALTVSRTNVPASTVDTPRVFSGSGGAKQSIDNFSEIQGSACVSQPSSRLGRSNNIDTGALSNSCDKAGRFQGKPLEKILVLEIFAGTGRLTAEGFHFNGHRQRPVEVEASPHRSIRLGGRGSKEFIVTADRQGGPVYPMGAFCAKLRHGFQIKGETVEEV